MDGIINIYKEKGFTSHDVVAKLRGILKQRKIGHTGTLDPDAEGVLPVCLGKATKLCDFLTEKEKTYRAVMLLGKCTDTQDSSGKVLEVSAVNVSEEAVCRTVESFIGPYEQIPPMYSAIKVDGKKLYELARAGKEIERKARPVIIFDIQIEKIELPRVTMTVNCSKGTYIRTLCHDIGQKLGCGGCMESLLRTQSGRFLLEDSLKLSQVEELQQSGRLEERLLPVDAVFLSFPKAVVKPEYNRILYNGNPLLVSQLKWISDEQKMRQQEIRIYDERNEFIGIYRFDSGIGRLRPVKLFLGGN